MDVSAGAACRHNSGPPERSCRRAIVQRYIMEAWRRGRTRLIANEQFTEDVDRRFESSRLRNRQPRPVVREFSGYGAGLIVYGKSEEGPQPGNDLVAEIRVEVAAAHQHRATDARSSSP